MNSCDDEPPIVPVSASTMVVVEPAGVEDRAVGGAHILVGRGQALPVGVEGVGVLHDELAAAHQAEARPDLVAELGLDLVEQ